MSKAKEKARAREQKILNFMKDEVKRKGYAPTVREIGFALGIKSTSTVHKDMVTRLEKIDAHLYGKVREILDINKAERHLRGGYATQRKFRNTKKKDA